MSEREFLELLNLYLDREITPADADRLEREIRSDAGRHRTYLQYCRMQQAVRLLGTAEGLPADSRPSVPQTPETGASRAAWAPRWVWSGTLAAAAALVLLFALRRPESATSAPANRLASESVRQDSDSTGTGPALGLSGDALLLSAFPATNSTPKVHEDQFNWMRQFQLVSLEARAGAPSLAPSTVSPQPTFPPAPQRPTGEDATEMAAFKFVK